MSNWQGLERQGASAPTDFTRALRMPPMPQAPPQDRTAAAAVQDEEQEAKQSWVEEWLAPPGTYVRGRRNIQPDLTGITVPPLTRKPRMAGFLEKSTFGLFKAPTGEAEELIRERTAAVQRQFRRPMNVVVANPHGGSGTTMCSLSIAGTFGALRGGSVLAWDNHESFGGMGVRTTANGGTRTVIDLLADAGNFDRIDARAGDLGGYWRAQPGAFFDVLVSDQDPNRSLEVGAAEFARIHHLVTRFRDLIVIDTGNNTRRPNFLAALDICDQLVIPTTIGADSLWAVSMLIDQLEAMGRAELVNTAVVILTDPVPGDRTNPNRQNALDWLGTWAKAIVEVPHDGHLAARSTIDYRLLAQPTRDAFLEAAALIAEGLTAGQHTSTQPPAPAQTTGTSALEQPVIGRSVAGQSSTNQGEQK